MHPNPLHGQPNRTRRVAALFAIVALAAMLFLSGHLPARGEANADSGVGSIRFKVVNTGGVQADAFGVHLDGGAAVPVSATGGGVTVPVGIGAHQVTEDNKPNYSLDGVAFIPAINGDAVCPASLQINLPNGKFDFTLDDQLPNMVICLYDAAFGHINFSVVNIDGDPADQFTVSIIGGQIPIKGGQTVSESFRVGPKTSSLLPKSGYTYLGWALGNITAGTCPSVAAATPGEWSHNLGQEGVRLCFYEQKVPTTAPMGHLHIRKVNMGGTQSDSFTVHVAGGPGVTISAASPDAVVEVPFGVLPITEDSAAGYSLVKIAYFGLPDFDWDCPEPIKLKGGPSVEVTIDTPDVAVCVFNKPVETTATVVVQKIYQSPGYTPKPQDEPTITIGGQAPDSHIGSPATQWQKTVSVAAGGSSIDIKEIVPAGWDVVSGFGDSCSATPGGPATSVTLTNVMPGQTRYVCFINRATAGIKVVKVDKTVGHSSWTFNVSGPSPVNPINVAGGNPNAGESTIVGGLPLGATTYTVSELMGGPSSCFASGFIPAYWTEQTTGSGGIALTTPGQVAVFTFVNTPCPRIPFTTPIVGITPVVTATPATATPTSTPGASQTPGEPGGKPTISATQPALSTGSDSTPTPTETSNAATSATPIAPSTGTGRGGATNDAGGAAAAAAGLLLVVVGCASALAMRRREE